MPTTRVIPIASSPTEELDEHQLQQQQHATALAAGVLGTSPDADLREIFLRSRGLGATRESMLTRSCSSIPVGGIKRCSAGAGAAAVSAAARAASPPSPGPNRAGSPSPTGTTPPTTTAVVFPFFNTASPPLDQGGEAGYGAGSAAVPTAYTPLQQGSGIGALVMGMSPPHRSSNPLSRNIDFVLMDHGYPSPGFKPGSSPLASCSSFQLAPPEDACFGAEMGLFDLSPPQLLCSPLRAY
eukprot:TRINITY_DN3640_c0_g1_i1.p1 TRINITY_DN3640_c0_g1~~TRINITY_DN3640_c0_g1_i1.p1  ORF type:complete len:240 (-),score=69.02 TRINITY_DN3640_c0_g1_i1:142-861(-)